MNRNPLRFIAAPRARRAFALALLGITLVGSSLSAFARDAKPALAHYAVSTKSVAAQAEFDAGLTYLYAFNPEEATYHFQAAARRDGALAMAYWGIALAAGPNVNTDYDLQRAEIGRAAVAQARRLDGRATAAERGLIDALAPRYGAANTAQILGAEAAYADAMTALARRNPNDLTIETLAAESLMDLTPLAYWRPDGRPGRYTQQIIALLHDVLRHQPDQLGANHYLIHVYEYSPTPQAALASATLLATLRFPPGAEHLAHMPAHIFSRVGDYDAAIRSSLAAAAMFRTYLGQQHSDVHNGYFHHDLQVLDYAYMMSGQWAKARDTATEIAAQVQDNGSAAETYLRFHRWHELLALPAPAQPGLRWQFAQAMAAAGTGDIRSARATIDAVAVQHDDDPRTAIALELLRAAVGVDERRNDVAIAALRQAVAYEDGLAAKEPPAWYYPIRETLGARLALTGHFAEAEHVFEDDLRRNPRNPRSLFGLAGVLDHTDPKRAPAMHAEFARAWRHADVKLTLSDL